jgi:phosphonate transport system permease protein
VILVFIVLSFEGSEINYTRLQMASYTIKEMAKQMTNINFEFLIGYGDYQFSEGISFLAIETLAIAFIGTLLGSILALPFGFLASKNISGRIGSKIGEFLLVVIRVFPEIILGIILVKGFGMNAFSGVLVIGLHSIGMIGKLFAEMIDNMDRSAIEALDAVGASLLQKIRFGIIPQVAADFTSVALYRLDINVRAATILGVVGAGGIGALITLAGQNSSWDVLGMIMITIVITVITVDTISAKLREKLV